MGTRTKAWTKDLISKISFKIYWKSAFVYFAMVIFGASECRVKKSQKKQDILELFTVTIG